MCEAMNILYIENMLSAVVCCAWVDVAFFLPSLTSIDLQILKSSYGLIWHLIFKTIFINFGFLGFGHYGVS